MVLHPEGADDDDEAMQGGDLEQQIPSRRRPEADDEVGGYKR